MAAKAVGVEAFSYVTADRFQGSCFEEFPGHQVTQATWDAWMAAIDAVPQVTPPCTNGVTTSGSWTFAPLTNFYSWPPAVVTPLPTPAPPPTAAPTPAPTPTLGPQQLPTPAPTPAPPISATGDPHLVNLLGQHFDIFRAGVHTLLQIPAGATLSTELLRVGADAVQLGGACGDMYFQAVNVTGRWVKGSRLQFSAKMATGRRKFGIWQGFGPDNPKGQVGLKVVQGHAGDGFAYLNVYARNLRQVVHPIGGLLGNDDHTAASTPGPLCKRNVSLLATQQSGDRASVAEVSGAISASSS